ncbi:MAG: LysM peptidoglycan-binding domain-containing protein, partial [Thermocrispum sp.]
RRPPRGTRVSLRSRGPVTSCAAPRAQQRWRLLLMTAAAVCVAVVALGAVIGGLAGGMATEVPQRTAVVAVAPGETLWDVAAKYAPESDPRAVVDRIEELNGVIAADVTAGYALTVPVQSQG